MDQITGGALDRKSMVCVDHESNLIIGGTYLGQSTTSIVYQSDTLLSGVNLTPDIVVFKLDAAGNLLWLKRIESSKDQTLYGIVADKTGHIVLNFKNTADATFQGHTMTPGTTIMKLYPNGDYEWHNTLTGMYNYQSNNLLTLDCVDNIITGGNTSFHLTGVPLDTVYNGQDPIILYEQEADSIGLNGAMYPPASTDVNLVVIKFLPDGSLFWLKQFPTEAVMADISAEFGTEIVFNGLMFGDTITLDTVTLIKNDPAAYYEYYYVKLNEEGTALWAHTYFDNAYPWDIRMAPGGSVYFSASFPFTTTYQSTTIQSNGYQDVLVGRLDPAGVFEWAHAVGDQYTNQKSILSVNKNGDVAISGHTSNTGDFGRKFDAQGNLLWVNPDNGDFGNNGTGPMAFDPEGNMWLIGWYNGDFSMGPYEYSIWGGPTYTFIAKFSNQDISGPLYTCMQTGATPATQLASAIPVRLSPNPAGASVEISGPATFSKIRIFSVDGKWLADIDPGVDPVVQIVLQGINPGLLFVECIDRNGQRSIQKLVKL